MKKYIFLFVITAFSTIGCKKYLNQQPITTVGIQQNFSTEQGAYESLAGVYSRLTGDQGYGIRLSLYYTVDNDETQGPGGAGGDGDRRDLSRYLTKASNAQLEKPFNQLFQGIDYANICIDQIPQMDLYKNGDPNTKARLKRMVGEALTLRAQFYFEAIRNWGDLPYHFEPAYKMATINPFPKRVNRDSIYDRLLSDLLEATTLVPWQSELAAIGSVRDERLTKATVKALRARIALFAGGFSLRPTSPTSGTMQRVTNYLSFYQIAKKECDEIIAKGENSLNPSFKNLWKEQVGKRVVNDPNGELLFQVTGIGGTSSADTKLGYYDGPSVGGFGNKSVIILPTYFYLFDSADTRREVTCAPYNVDANFTTKVGTSITAINQAKYRRDWSSFSGSTTLQWFGAKWQIIRYADVLLMLAEAENEINNGPTAAAYDAINKVRRRGFGKDINTANAQIDIASGLSKSDFFDALVKERSLEFGGEGIRKFDLIRWNLLDTKINETRTNLTNLAAGNAPYNRTPTSMYLITGATGDDASIWSNSFFSPAPTSTPAGTTKVSWRGTGITTTNAARFANGFTAGKSELFPIPQAALSSNPNLTQNPGY